MSDKLKTWTVIRMVKEVYEVQAVTREQAKLEASLKGDPSAIYVISEHAKPKT